MSADDRHAAIDDAVDTYNHANPTATLPRTAARLLGVMFADSDVCRQSLDTLARRGFDRGNLPRVLRALVAAGFLSIERGSGHTANSYHLHLPPRSQP